MISDVLHNPSTKKRNVIAQRAENDIKEALAWELSQKAPGKYSVYGIDLGHRYVTHGSVAELYKHCGLDPKSIAEYIQEVRKVEK